MSTEQLVEKIKSKGYWRVLLRPTTFDKRRIGSLSAARDLIGSCTVSWRGWDYPHWNQQTVRNMTEWVESSEDWDGHLEYWRFYPSGQFVHFVAVEEDHIDMERILPTRYPPRPSRAGYLSFVSATLWMTEVFEFAARLANKDILRPSAFVSVGLHNMRNHQLTTWSSTRYLPDDFVYTGAEPIVVEREIPQRELVAEPDSFALDYIVEIFERFGWMNPSRELLGEDQKRMRERRL